MVLVAHKILDTINGNDKRMTFKIAPGYREEGIEMLRWGLKVAEKFDFGLLPMEADPDNPRVLSAPKLTDAEIGFWADDLVPLPSHICWYEFEVKERVRSGLLISQHESYENIWVISRVDWIPGERTVYFDDLWIGLSRVRSGPESRWDYSISGNEELIRRREKLEGNESVLAGFNGIVAIAVYLTLMLHSRTTEKHVEPAPRELNRAREKRGVVPLFEHRVVRIVPSRYIDRGNGCGGHHRSPRLHWRRSHLRRFDHETPNSKWHEEWKCWVVVIPRFLVGREELGEITHDYWVRPGKVNLT